MYICVNIEGLYYFLFLDFFSTNVCNFIYFLLFLSLVKLIDHKMKEMVFRRGEKEGGKKLWLKEEENFHLLKLKVTSIHYLFNIHTHEDRFFLMY